MRRDQLFALCTPAEQRRLVAAAEWCQGHDPTLLAKPNVLTESASAVFDQRSLRPLHPGAPSLLTRMLAKASSATQEVEARRSSRMQADFIAYLAAIQEEGAADELLGVVHFLRVVPVLPGTADVRQFNQQLGELAARCVADARVPIARRFAAAMRCKLWDDEVTGYSTPQDLDLQVWRLLLELAAEDVDAALRVIDEHWASRTSPHLLSTIALHEDPQLACQLAVKLQPHRPDFAAEMLGTSILHASFQLSRIGDDAAAELRQVMDASCAVLADWTLAGGRLGAPAALSAFDALFRFGNPSHPYWRELPPHCLALLRGLPAGEPVRPLQLQLLASVVFYTDRADPVGAEALALLEAATLRALSPVDEWLAETDILRARGPAESSLGRLANSVSDLDRRVLTMLEDKTRAGRNRHFPPCPEHPLLHLVDRALDAMLLRVFAAAPRHALEHYIMVARSLSHETLVRKHHRLLREQFAGRARSFPEDAGLALARLVQYCGYSQSHDETYRKDLCRESFDMLLPLLEAISARDAAVARTGIGWSPRPDI